MAFDQQKYISDYVKENYDQVMVKVPKGKKIILKELAAVHNITDDRGKISVNRMIIECLEEKYHIDLSRSDTMLPNIPTAPAAKPKDQGR